MSILDRLFGRNLTMEKATPATTDAQSLERYEYLLRTAKPDTIEQAHVDAFDRLSPQQRDLVFDRLLAVSPAAERPLDASSATLAKTITRAESRRPGIVTRILGDDPTGDENGGRRATADAGSLLGSFATYAIASTAIDAIFWAGLIGSTVAADDGSWSAQPESTDTGGDDFGGNDFAGNDFFGGFDF